MQKFPSIFQSESFIHDDCEYLHQRLGIERMHVCALHRIEFEQSIHAFDGKDSSCAFSVKDFWAAFVARILVLAFIKPSMVFPSNVYSFSKCPCASLSNKTACPKIYLSEYQKVKSMQDALAQVLCNGTYSCLLYCQRYWISCYYLISPPSYSGIIRKSSIPIQESFYLILNDT